MDLTVRHHIERLERRIQELGTEMMRTKDRARLNLLESEIRIANLALTHYRTALELESNLNKIS